MTAFTVERRSRLAAPAERVWAHAISLAGINREMAPWLAMTAPPAYDGLTLDDPRVELGVRLFASSIRLFGVVPVDRMELTIVELDRAGFRFVEESPMRAMRRWRHERSIEPDGADACVLRDRITADPRVPMPGGRRVLAAFFGHRHRRLRALFGAA